MAKLFEHHDSNDASFRMGDRDNVSMLNSTNCQQWNSMYINSTNCQQWKSIYIIMILGLFAKIEGSVTFLDVREEESGKIAFSNANHKL